MTSSVYWLSLFTCDFLSYLFPVVVMLIIIPIMNVASFVVPAAMGVLFMASLTYMQSNILLAYVASFIFSSVETCQSVLPPVLNLVCASNVLSSFYHFSIKSITKVYINSASAIFTTNYWHFVTGYAWTPKCRFSTALYYARNKSYLSHWRSCVLHWSGIITLLVSTFS